jgi:hypothetical protein
MSKCFVLFLFLISAAHAQTIEKKVFIEPLGENASRYYYVPFEVPARARSLSVSYEYDRKDGANTLDLGVFDVCASDAENDLCGFRGWSGGRRGSIFIAETEASHGYIAGKIPAGEWRVILGLYKIAPEGVGVTVRVKINEIDAAARVQFNEEKAKTFNFPKNPKNAAPVSNGYTWFRGDLHAHTFHSDGNWTVKGILDYATANNLDFIGVTEHNTFSHHKEIEAFAPAYKNLLVLRGEEVTTYGGHFNVWGLPNGKLIDFRVTPKDSKSLQQIVAGVRKLGLLASINHPTAVCGGCDWSYGDWQNADSVEIWNGSWDAQDEAALKKWDELLQKGQRIAATGASDSHNPPKEVNSHATNLAVGSPANFVGMKRLTQKELLRAIKRGRLWISENPSTYDLNFWASVGNKIVNLGETAFEAISENSRQYVRLNAAAKNFPETATISVISNGKTLLKEILADKKTVKDNQLVYSLPFEINAPKSYFRVEVRSEKGAMLALTNPIFVEIKK